MTDIFVEIDRLRTVIEQLTKENEDLKLRLNRLEYKMLELKPELNQP